MKRLAEDVLSTRQRRMIGVQLEVARLAREFGIALDRVQYENQIIDNGALERFGIVVPLSGGYTNLRKFIHAVESSENFLVIERVALGQGKSADVIELNITLATYFIAPDAKLDDLGKKPIVPAKTS
jgi:Tfp pilus assembly protein PilO